MPELDLPYEWPERTRGRGTATLPERRPPERVLVLGAGVIGVTTAYYLRRAGFAVRVIDRRPGPAMETSFANGGQISATHATPWASPETLRRMVDWLGREDAPLVFHLRADPALLSWGLRFLANCSSGRMRRNTARTLRLALYSRACLREVRKETGIAYDHATRGILHLCRTRRDLDRALAETEVMNAMGCRRTPLTTGGCRDVEPALSSAPEPLAGGIFSPEDETGDAYLFTSRLARRCAEMGVEFRFGVSVQGLRTEGDRVLGVETEAGTEVADGYVAALGSYTPALLRPHRIRLPVYPAKGYSATIPVDGGAPEVGVIDDSRKIVYSRLGNRLRVAGTAELAGWDADVDRPKSRRRARAILETAKRQFPTAGHRPPTLFWAGLRPQTPDHAPVIGRAPLCNLFLNTGHGTLGWTMACGSGHVLADLLAGREPAIPLDGLGLERFGGLARGRPRSDRAAPLRSAKP